MPKYYSDSGIYSTFGMINVENNFKAVMGKYHYFLESD